MLTGEILQKLGEIAKHATRRGGVGYRDNEAAHIAEDELRVAFIEHVAAQNIPILSDKARLVLLSKQIDFERWYS